MALKEEARPILEYSAGAPEGAYDSFERFMGAVSAVITGAVYLALLVLLYALLLVLFDAISP